MGLRDGMLHPAVLLKISFDHILLHAKKARTKLGVEEFKSSLCGLPESASGG